MTTRTEDEHEHWPQIVEQEADGRQHGACEDCGQVVEWDGDVEAFVVKEG